MTGLAEILEENSRLRELADAMRASLSEAHRSAALARAEADDARAEADKARGLAAERAAMIETLREKAEQLARRLELIDLERKRPANLRYVPVEQDFLPFGGAEPKPTTPVAQAPADDENAEPLPEDKPRRVFGKARRRNRSDLDHLPVRKVSCSAAEKTCVRCGGSLSHVGVATSFRVEWIPGRFEVHDIAREKVACRACPGEGVLTATGPYALDRSIAGNGLVARVLVDKFADHLPVNRQVKRMEREGFQVGSQTVSAWICGVVSLLGCIANAVLHDLLEAVALQGDDSGMPVQDGEDGHLRKGRFWAITDQQQAFYAFTDTKAGEHPVALLKGFKGRLLLVDGGSEFNRVVREKGLGRAGCWSHLRTYFFNALPHHPVEADLALRAIGRLFAIERGVWGAGPDTVLAERQARSRDAVDDFYAWVKATSLLVRPSTTLAEAVGYALRQEREMRLFLEHGELPMHNNLSELLLRQPVVGRKNWLFARSEGGARAAAVIYTLIGSCKLQGIDPWLYLRDVLDRLLDFPANRVHELTPKNWRAAREGHTL